MPYSEYAVNDRKAVSQLKYHIRRFAKQMKAAGVAQEDYERIMVALHEGFLEAAGTIEFDDDGSRIATSISN